VNYQDDPRLHNLLAGEYVLGLLRGPARRRFERLMMGSRTLSAEVTAWEGRFAQWALSLAPIDPPGYIEWRLMGRVRAESRPVPATLLGFSWGALLALLFALENPEPVARLALVGPGPAWPEARARYEAEFERRQAAPSIASARAELSRSGLRERDPDAFWRRAFELSVAGYFKDAARAKNLTPFRLSSRAQQAVQESLKGADLRARLHEIQVPALILHGRHDPVPLESSETLARLMPAARLVVFEDSGHALYAEETERFVREMDAFLPRHAA